MLRLMMVFGGGLSPMSYAGNVKGTEFVGVRLPPYPRGMPKTSAFRYFKTSPEIIRLAVMMYTASRCLCVMSKTCYMNAASASAPRPSGSGGNGSPPSLPTRFAGNGYPGFTMDRSGVGIWMRSS